MTLSLNDEFDAKLSDSGRYFETEPAKSLKSRSNRSVARNVDGQARGTYTYEDS
jgi:hypothetical protein